MTETAPGNQLLTKRIFFISLFFFLLLQAYGIYFNELRIQYDGSAALLWESLGKSVMIPFHREAWVLNKLLMYLSFQFHLPLKAIHVIFCANDLLYYLTISGLILTFTKRYDFAAAVLAAPVLLHGYNFYFIINEMFLSGALMVLYTACYKYMARGMLRNAVLCGSVFFIIWSHPATLIMLFIFLGGLYFSLKQLREDKWLLLFISINVVVRVLYLSPYDTMRMDNMQHGALNLSGLVEALGKYLSIYWFIILIAFGLVFSVRKKTLPASQFKGLFIVPFVFLLYRNPGYPVDDANFIKYYLYPGHLYILMQGISALAVLPSYFRKVFIPVLITSFVLSGYLLINTGHRHLTCRLNLIKKLNELCYREDANHSKWFVNNKKHLWTDDYLNMSVEPIYFSAVERQTPTVALVCGSPELFAQIKKLPADFAYINEDAQYSVKQLNSNGYLNLTEGGYKELVLDSSKRAILRSVICLNR